MRFRPDLPVQADALQASTTRVRVASSSTISQRWIDVAANYVYWGRDQAEFFAEAHVQELIAAALSGLPAVIFGYGATGSGKTYTMYGGEWTAGTARDPDMGAEADQTGLAARIVHGLYTSPAFQTSCQVAIQALEVYNEQVFDLLSSEALTGHSKPVQVRVRPGCNGNAFDAVGATVLPCVDAADALAAIRLALNGRHTLCTALNAASSRGHTMLTLHIMSGDEGAAGGMQLGRVTLVDLAGSERLGGSASSTTSAGASSPAPRASSTQARRFTTRFGDTGSGVGGAVGGETGAIHRSLLALGRVVDALAASKSGDSHLPPLTPMFPLTPMLPPVTPVKTPGSGRPSDAKSRAASSLSAGPSSRRHSWATTVTAASQSTGSAKTGPRVPYRASKLTQLLADALGGGALTLMIACIRPDKSAEALSTLRFAARASRIRNTPAASGHADKDAIIAALRKQIAVLKEENAHLRAELHTRG